MSKLIQHIMMWMLVLLTIRLFISCGGISIDDLPHSAGFKKVFNLPEQLAESSGIILYDSLIWTFNDSGNDNKLYGLDIQNGQIRKEIILNTSNVDWEDITQDEEFIYLGDFGNNNGSRKDLCVNIIPKNNINSDTVQSLNVEKINFFYEDQGDFESHPESNKYDCESLFSFGDSLYLFTKNWIEEITGLYQLPKTPGNFPARKQASFESDGLVTGADFNLNSHELVLCGYKQYVPYMIYFNDAETLNLYDIPKERVNFFDHFGLQIEGITIYHGTVYMCAENSSEKQAVFSYTPEY